MVIKEWMEQKSGHGARESLFETYMYHCHVVFFWHVQACFELQKNWLNTQETSAQSQHDRHCFVGHKHAKTSIQTNHIVIMVIIKIIIIQAVN